MIRLIKRRDSALYPVFKVALRLSERWRLLNRGRNLMGLPVDGASFKHGIFGDLPVSVEEAVVACWAKLPEAYPTTFNTNSKIK